jgi:hypothetical protein
MLLSPSTVRNCRLGRAAFFVVILQAAFVTHALALTPVPDPAPTPTGTSTPDACVGDCNRNGEVTVDELLTMVSIALGKTFIFSVPCRAADADGNGAVQITEITAAVDRTLNGCAGPEYGTCYESSTCVPDPNLYFSFSASRGYCCQLWLREHGVPFSWCSANMIDPSSGLCTECDPPC